MKVTRSERRWDVRHLLLISAILVPLFILTGHWNDVGNPDAFAAATPAWQVTRNGTLDLSMHNSISDNLQSLDRWFVEVESGAVYSNRPPGVISIAVPAYLIAGRTQFSNGPAVATALVATTVALLVMRNVLGPLVGSRFATASVLTLALGTTTWWISSSELWPHGPGQLWAALACASLARGSFVGTGLSFALSILTRPVTSVFAAVTGAAEAIRLRSWRPFVVIGLTSALGLLLLMAFNRLLFGSWNITGGYGDAFTTGAVRRFTIIDYVLNLGSMLIGPRHGVLVTSPIVGVSAVGLVLAWRRIPGWARSAVFAALAYLIVHAFLNRASGGMVIFYRYPLEALALATPALAVGAKALMERGRFGSRVVIGGAILSVALQLLYVFYLTCTTTDPVFRTCLAA